MTNDQGQNLFAPTRGIARASLMHRGAVERGGCGQPDPGSDILEDASTVRWTNVVEPGESDSARRSHAVQSVSVRQRSLPTVFQAADTGGVTPDSSTANMERAAASIRQGATARLWPMSAHNYQELIKNLTGRSVIADFLVGPGMQRRTGIITHVGTGYFVLCDPLTAVQTGCDLLALRFLTVLPEDKKTGPACALKWFCRL